MTGGLGPDSVIDAVGMEAHGFAPDNILEVAKQKVGVGVDRAHALREALVCVRKGGRVSIPGVYLNRGRMGTAISTTTSTSGPR